MYKLKEGMCVVNTEYPAQERANSLNCECVHIPCSFLALGVLDLGCQVVSDVALGVLVLVVDLVLDHFEKRERVKQNELAR